MKQLNDEDKRNIEELIQGNIIGSEFFGRLPLQPQRLLIVDTLTPPGEYILIERGLRSAIDPYHNEEDVKRLAGEYVSAKKLCQEELSFIALFIAKRDSFTFDSSEEAFQWLMRPFKEN